MCRTVSKRTEFSSYFSFPLLSFLPFFLHFFAHSFPISFPLCLRFLVIVDSSVKSVVFQFDLLPFLPRIFPPMFFSSHYESKSLSVLIQTKLEFWHSLSFCAKSTRGKHACRSPSLFPTIPEFPNVGGSCNLLRTTGLFGLFQQTMAGSFRLMRPGSSFVQREICIQEREMVSIISHSFSPNTYYWPLPRCPFKISSPALHGPSVTFSLRTGAEEKHRPN